MNGLCKTPVHCRRKRKTKLEKEKQNQWYFKNPQRSHLDYSVGEQFSKMEFGIDIISMWFLVFSTESHSIQPSYTVVIFCILSWLITTKISRSFKRIKWKTAGICHECSTYCWSDLTQCFITWSLLTPVGIRFVFLF